MHVEVRLFATLREGRFNRRTLDLPEGTSVGGLLERLAIPPGVPGRHVILPLVNGRHAKPDQPLADGDIVAIFPAVAGG